MNQEVTLIAVGIGVLVAMGYLTVNRTPVHTVLGPASVATSYTPIPGGTEGYNNTVGACPGC